MASRLFLVFIVLTTIASAAAAQERQWSLDASDEDVYLIFGVPDTDDVGLSLWCPIQSNEVNVFVPEVNTAVQDGEDVSVILKADDTTTTFQARTEPDQNTGGTSLEGKIAVSDPIFAAMIAADRLKVKVGEEENVYPLIEADVAGLLDLCRSP